MAESERRLPLDLRIFALLALVWGVSLVLRVLTQSGMAMPGDTFQAVLGGVKFYGTPARLAMLLESLVYMAFAAGILRARRWGLVVALIYMAQVVLGHLIFIVSYFNQPGQEIHVKIAAIEGPITVLILLYLWIRSKAIVVPRTPSGAVTS